MNLLSHIGRNRPFTGIMLLVMLVQLGLGAEIPDELYQAIVDIYVYFLNYTGEKPAETVISQV